MNTYLEGRHSVEYMSAFLKAECARLLVNSTEKELTYMTKQDLIERIGKNDLIPFKWNASFNHPGFENRWVIRHEYTFSNKIDNFEKIVEKSVDEVLNSFCDHRETFSLKEFPIPSSRIQDGKLVYRLK